MYFLLIAILLAACSDQESESKMEPINTTPINSLKLFLCGDVMTGRGIDQALPHSVDPVLYEPYVKDARQYLQLAERENGPIETPVDFNYPWGDALDVWETHQPAVRIINLETSVTRYDRPWPGKGIQYRMHPKNVPLLAAADIDHCVLANNHTLDWSRPGLIETMNTLRDANIDFSGVGVNKSAALKPSVFETEHGRILIFSYGSPTSGIPASWAASDDSSGINFLPELNEAAVSGITENIARVKKSGDLVVFSIHWGGNWGYDVPPSQRNFAHALIDEAGVDVVYGHSSHHPKGLEIYRDKLIIYGAGDFLNDYEGIGGHEEYRAELCLMYFPKLDPATGNLVQLMMVPMEVRQFQLHRATAQDSEWLRAKLDEHSNKLGASVILDDSGELRLVSGKAK